MRRHTRHVFILLTFLTLNVLVAPVLPVKNQNTDDIKSKLGQLRDNLKHEHPSLENKVVAVIHQIEAGAFTGALNKLQNDVKRSVIAWVENPEDLIKLIDEIIDLIKGIVPPPPPPDFEISADPSDLAILQGAFDTSTITLTSKKGFSQEITLTNTTSAPSGVTLSLDPYKLTLPPHGSVTSTLRVEVAIDAVPGQYTITVTATSARSSERNARIALEVIALPPTPDFLIEASPNTLTIQQGDSDTSIITVTSLHGFTEPVTLAITSDPITDVAATLNPTQITPPPGSFAIAILTLDTEPNAVIGSYDIVVTGSSGALEHSANVALEISAPPTPPVPDFSIKAAPDSLTVEQGGSAETTIIVISHRGFSKTVYLTVASPTDKFTITLNPSQVTPDPDGFATSTLNVSVAGTAIPDDYVITVTGNSNNDVTARSVDISLKIVAEKTPPEIVSVARLPETPDYNQSVTVLASVVESGSGLKQVILNYSANAEWTTVYMTIDGEIYQASIPAFSFDTTVEYYIQAIDNADNSAVSDFYSYTVIDPYPPILRIDNPMHGSYVAGTVDVTVFMKDQNGGRESGFAGADLSINGTIVKSWQPPAPSEPDTYNWDTAAFGPDGTYVVELEVRDKAGNIAGKRINVNVDNTAPSAEINMPASGSYLRLLAHITVTANDANFDKMQVFVDDQLIKTSTSSGTEVTEWNTQDYNDGAHTIILTVYDKAGNVKQVTSNVIVDNTPPSIGIPTWSPSEPPANSDIQINVTVTEPTYGSGVESVALRFKNRTIEEWQFVPMQLENGNWTTTLRNQSDTIVEFFIEAIDKAGNKQETEGIYQFTVAPPYAIPLAWILALILAIAAIIGGSAYYVSKKQKKRETAPSP